MKWVLMFLTALSMWPTLRSLLDARVRCGRLAERGHNGPLKRDCEHNRSREYLRLVKHGILVVGVALAFFDLPLPFRWDLVEARTTAMILVSWLIGWTSEWDRRYMRGVEDAWLERDCVEGAESSTPPAPPAPPKEMQL